MNNSNSGLPTISSVTGGGQNPMIINDDNSITYFNTQQAGSANLAQQQALMVNFLFLSKFSRVYLFLII